MELPCRHAPTLDVAAAAAAATAVLCLATATRGDRPRLPLAANPTSSCGLAIQLGPPSFLYVFIDHLSMFASASCIIKLLQKRAAPLDRFVCPFACLPRLSGHWASVDFPTGDKLLAVIEMCNNLSSNLIVTLLRFGTRAHTHTGTLILIVLTLILIGLTLILIVLTIILIVLTLAVAAIGDL